MIIGYGAPAVESVVLGAGAAWLTSDEGAALVDGKPGRAARVQRISGPLAITLNFQSPIVLGVVALLGLNLPEGVTITAAGAARSPEGLLTVPSAAGCSRRRLHLWLRWWS